VKILSQQDFTPRVAGSIDYPLESFMSRLAGRATAAGTLGFIHRANIPFHHTLNNGLSINPIILGPPKYLLGPNSADLNIETAVM
jgi:hypothetical protein